MLKRIQVKLILLYSALFILVQGATYMALYQITAPQIENQIKQQLSYSRTLVTDSVNSRMDELVEGTRLLSSDFGFRAAVATADRATILSALQNLTQRIGSDHAMLISLDNEIIADTSDPDSLQNRYYENEELIDIADEYDVASAFMMLGEDLNEFVIVPVLAPIPIAWIGVSIHLDDAKAHEIKTLLPDGLDLSFYAESSDNEWSLLASTLEADMRTRMATSAELTKSENKIQTLQLADDENVLLLATGFPAITQQQKVIAVLQYSLDVAFKPYTSMVIGLSLLATISLLALILGSIIIARGVTAPMRLLAAAASRISVGDYTPVQNFKAHLEVDQLANSFNHMIHGIQQREKKIRHQAEHDLETGLPNRLHCENFLEQIIEVNEENGHKTSTMIISIQRFSDIQNTLGYTVGEDLIKHIIPCLEKAAPQASMIARLTTTRFILVLSHTNDEEPTELAQHMLARFKEPMHLGDVAIDVILHIGIATYPDDAEDVESLLRRTNIANLQARENIDHIARYDAEKDSHYADRLSMMSELRRGIEQGSLMWIC